MKKIRISESRLNNIVRKAIMNEVNATTKASGFVRANDDITKLQKMRSDGNHTFNKNGREVDIDNEINRKTRQMQTFGNGFAHDLSMQYAPEREKYQTDIDKARADINYFKDYISKIENGEEKDSDGYKMRDCKANLERAMQKYRRLVNSPNGYKVTSSSNGEYHIETPKGLAYSDMRKNGIQYSDAQPSNVNRLSKLRDITDAMAGYHDDLSGAFDDEVQSLKRRQRNVKALRDYDDERERWHNEKLKADRAQAEYDRMSPLNPKKWFKKRPNGAPAEPKRPSWENNADGQFDGYFSHERPEEYDADIDNVRALQKRYRDAKDKFFNK